FSCKGRISSLNWEVNSGQNRRNQRRNHRDSTCWAVALRVEFLNIAIEPRRSHLDRTRRSGAPEVKCRDPGHVSSPIRSEVSPDALHAAWLPCLTLSITDTGRIP